MKKNETPETPAQPEQASAEPQVETVPAAPTAQELSPEEQLAWNRCVEQQTIIDNKNAAIDQMNAKIAELELGIGQCKESYEGACKCIAEMHAAAVGEVREPIRSILGDIEDLRAERDALKTQALAAVKRQEELESEFGAPPTAETLKLAAKLLEEAIFHSGNLSTNEANSLRPMVAALRDAAGTTPPPAPVTEDTPGEIPVSHFSESVVVEPDDSTGAEA